MSFQSHDNPRLRYNDSTEYMSNYEGQHYISHYVRYFWEATVVCRGWLEHRQWDVKVEVSE